MPDFIVWEPFESAGRLVHQALIFRENDPRPIPAIGFEERTARFGEAVIRFARNTPRNPVNNRLIDQLVGAATSVGANFCEATESVSGRDSRHNTSRCLKEAKESRFFLRMVAAAEPSMSEEARNLYRESVELSRILYSMKSKSTSRESETNRTAC